MWKNKVMTLRTFLFSFLVLGLICFTNATGGQESDPSQRELLNDAGRSNDNDTDSDGPTRGKELVDEALIPVYDMANYFLEDIVQTHDLNYMAERGVDFSDFDSILDSFENDYKEWANYAIGYAVCVFLGVLLLVFVPLVGFLVCCCRTCCGSCGGKVDPRETSHSECKRYGCGLMLFIIISFVLLGSLAMFFTALRVKDELYSDEDIFHSIADGMETMGGYVNTTLDDLEGGTLGVYNKTVDDIFDTLDNVVTDAYNTLDEAAGISANIEPLLAFTEQMQNLTDTLTEVQSNAFELQDNVTDLNSQFESLKTHILGNLTGCSSIECNETFIAVDSAMVQVNYTDITTGYVNLTAVLDVAVNNGLDQILRYGYGNFTGIITDVNASVIDEINSAREAAHEVSATIGEELDNVREDIGGIDFDEVVEDFRNFDETELAANITYWSLGGIAYLIALIVLITYLGLLFSCCPRAKREEDYCCTRKMGATCLLAGVGFTFILFWIFILILIPMFLVAGLTHTEICRHLVALDQTPISGIIDDLVNASISEEAGFSINITGIYTGCKENQAFYTALDAENTFGFNLTELLDVSEIEGMIDDLSELDIPIGNITILSNKTVNRLETIADPLSEAATDTETYLVELRKNVTSENLIYLAEAVRSTNVNYSEVLASDLERLYNDSVIPIDKKRSEVGSMLKHSQDGLNTNISGISQNLLDGQHKTNTEGEDIVQNVINITAYDVMNLIDSAVSDIDGNVRYEIGKCEPVYGAVATIIDAGCVELLYALNGYWFAMGWTVFLLLVSVVFSFKLSTVYRKTLDHGAEIPERRGGGRPPKNQRQRNNDSTVLLVRNDSHEMIPVNNPVFVMDGQHQKIPRPHLKPGIVYCHQETSPFVDRPPSYSKN